MKLFIDGENCRQALSKILQEEGLVKASREITKYRLADLLRDVTSTKANDLDIRYYASEIKLPSGYKPTAETMKQVNKIKEYSRKWVPNLQLQKIEYIKAGNLKVRQAKPCANCGKSLEVLQEKGVDVRVAVDMLESAYSGKDKKIVVMSSDTDLCPALHKVRAKGVRLVYLCFADSLNRAVSAVCHETLTIPRAKVVEYYKTTT